MTSYIKASRAEAIVKLEEALAMLRAPVAPGRICPVCRNGFTPRHPAARTCSDKCRQADYRRRRRDAAAAI